MLQEVFEERLKFKAKNQEAHKTSWFFIDQN